MALPRTIVFISQADGDGRVWATKSSLDKSFAWNNSHNAATGTGFDTAGSSMQASATLGKFSGSYTVTIQRAFLPFDTSKEPGGVILVNPTLKLRTTSVSKQETGSGPMWINIVGETTQASDTDLEVADYDQCQATHSPVTFATQKNIADIGGAYQDWTLNAAAIAAFSTALAAGTFFKIGVRCGHDILDEVFGADSGHARYTFEDEATLSLTGVIYPQVC